LWVERLEDRCTPSSAVFAETDLVSDLAGRAKFTDPNLVNPWGIAYAQNGPFWVSDNGSGNSTLYDGSGNVIPLVVAIPPPNGSPPGTLGTPTGVAFNSHGLAFKASQFVFASEDGTISGWNGGAQAFLEVDRSSVGAVYKGLDIGVDSTNRTLLYAANFRAGTIDVFDQNFQPAIVPGGFKDGSIPAGFAPFDIQNLGGLLYVTYALQDAARHDDLPGPGNGFVDVFNTDGQLLKQLVAQGPLNSPWGLAIAPTTYGPFSNALLVGNFGDGHINAFDPTSGAFLGQFVDNKSIAITIDGLWGLKFGNNGQAGTADTLYFTAGLNNEADGLFGTLALSVVPTGSTTQISSAPLLAQFGETVTLTATVTSQTGVGTPTGQVTFTDGVTVLGSATLIVDPHTGLDQATLQVSTLAVGMHTINATYGGDTNFSGSDSLGAPADVAVVPADTTTTVSAVPSAIDVGQSVTLTAVVSAVAPGAGIPTGTVTFQDGGLVLGSGTLDAGGTATLSVSNLAVGSHSLNAVYATDGNYNSSNSTAAPAAVTVNPDVSLPGLPLPADTVGIAYDQTLTASGGTGAITLTVSNVAGPTGGLNIPANGVNSLDITGTPTTAGTVTFTLTAVDTVGGVATQDYSLPINPQVSLDPTTLPMGEVQVAYNSTITALGGTGNKTLTVTNITGAVPGLNIPLNGTDTLTLSGTPTAAGLVMFTLTATDTLGATSQLGYTVTINPPISLPGSPLPADTVGVTYDQTLAASGGTGAIALTISNVAGPTGGLNIPANATNGFDISGTPTTAGTVTFTLTAVDTLGGVATQDYSLPINPAVSLDPATLPMGEVQVAYNSTITALGGTGSKTLAVTNITGAVPGLNIPLNGTDTLTLSGTPTTAGLVSFTLTATDTLGALSQTQYSIPITALSLTPAVLPNGAAGVPYSQTLTASGGVGNKALVVSNVTGVVTGLSIPGGGTNTLTVAGTPIGTGTITFTLTATDANSQSLAANYSLTVVGGAPAKVIFATGPQALQAGQPSGVITLELHDGFDNVAAAGAGGVVLSLATDSAHGTFLDTASNPLATPPQVTFSAGATSASFKYEDTTAGTPTLSATGGFSATQQEGVTAAHASRLVFAVATQGVASGFIPITINATDPFGNIDHTYNGMTALALTGNAIGGRPLAQTVIPMVDGTCTFDKCGLGVPGNYALIANSTDPLAPASSPVHVIAAPKFRITLAPATSGQSGVGQKFNATVTAVVKGAAETNYLGAVHFTSSDPLAVLPKDYQFQPGDNGSKTFTVIFNTAGKQTVTATDVSLKTATGTSSAFIVSNFAIVLDHFLVAGLPSTSVSGVPHVVTITAANVAGQTVPTFTGTVQVTSSDPACPPTPLTFTAADKGIKHIAIALMTPGPQSVSALGAGKSGIAPNINVVSPAMHLGISLASLKFAAGDPVTLTVVGLTQSGKADPLFADTLQVTTSDTQAHILPQLIVGGVEKYTIMFTTAGTQTITVTDVSRPGITGHVVRARVNPGQAARLGVSGFPIVALASTPQRVTVTALDAFGNRVVNGFADTVQIAGQTYTFKPGEYGKHAFAIALPAGLQTLSAVDATSAGVQTGTEANLTVVDAAVALALDPTNPAAQALIVIAPPRGTIVITPVDAAGTSVTVTVNGKAAPGGPFAPTGHIIVFGQAASSTVRVAANGQGATVSVPVLMFAGTGNSLLSAAGSSAGAVLVGGPGRDTLIGGSGRTILIGGGGIDNLQAGTADTILIGGSTTYDANVIALAALLAEWSRTDVDYAQRLQDLSTGGGQNATFVLNSATLRADRPGNQLTGGSGKDWFWLTYVAGAIDRINAYQPGEVAAYE
jgi:uncharacterized protein (TIGR03118 family)